MQSSTETTQNAGGSQACAVCKFQRRKCTKNCLLAPFFPPNCNKDFLNARKLFGVRNITKLIKNLSFQERVVAIKTITFESNVRASDPVGGCYRYMCELQKQNDRLQAELDILNQRLAVCKAMFNQNQQQSAENQVNVGVGGQNFEGCTIFESHEWSAYNVFDSSTVQTEIDPSSNVDEEDDTESLLVNKSDDKRDSSLGFGYGNLLSDVGEDIKPLLPFLDDKREKPFCFYFDSNGRSKIQNSDKLVWTERAGSSFQQL